MKDRQEARGDVGTVRPDDVEVRDIGRRSFLERVGAMAGLAVVMNGCGGSDPTDSDRGDPVIADGDATDPVVADEDRGDPADSD